MQEFTVRHKINCSAERFWELYKEDGFTKEMLLDGLKFPEARIDKREEDDDEVRRTMYVVPRVDVPPAVAKLIGPGVAYTEEGVLDKKNERWRWKLRLSVLSEKISITGTMRIDPVDDDHCRRISDVRVEAKIFGIGKIVEKAVEKNVRDGWDASARWMNGWLAKQ